MGTTRTRWLIYTVLVGMLPIFARLLIWSVMTPKSIQIVNALDFVTLGLVLHISNINEIEHFTKADRQWKTIHNGTSIAFICFYSVLFATYNIGEVIPGFVNTGVLTYLVIALTGISLTLSYSVYHRVSKLTGDK